MSLVAAKECFKVQMCILKTLPVMRSIPGRYNVNHRRTAISRQQGVRLTSLAHAKMLALRERGIEELKEEDVWKECSDYTLSWAKLSLWNAYWRTPLELGSYDPYKALAVDSLVTDPYGGMGAAYFPSLINGRLEQGLWDLGCNNLEPQWLDDRLSPELLGRLVPQGYEPK